jgi:hypothetical protein
LQPYYGFHLQPVDLAKLLVIRKEKIKKKNDRLFEQMGLSNTTNATATSKKIFLSKQTTQSKSDIDSNTTRNGNTFRFHHIFELHSFFTHVV